MACYAMLFRVLPGVAPTDPMTTPLIRAAATCAVLLALRHAVAKEEVDLQSRAIPFLLLTGLMALALIPTNDEALRVVFSSVAQCVWPLLYYLLWLILLDAGERTALGPVRVFAAGWLVLNVLLVVLAPLAGSLLAQVGSGSLPLAALAFLLAYTILVATMLVRARREREERETRALLDREELKRFFEEQSADIEQRLAASNALAHEALSRLEKREAGSGAAQDGGVDAAFLTICEEIAREHGLTARELDVLNLLARGRSIPVVCETLFISQSTAKGHANRIYAKLGVAGKQELIALVEERLQESR